MEELIQKKIISITISIIFLSAGFYIYFASLTINKIRDKNIGIQNLQTVNSSYQKLEENYYELLNKLDLNYARSLGFVEIGQKQNNLIVRQKTVISQR